MSNWREHQVYCRICGAWYGGVAHKYCPRGQHGSLTFIDTESFQMGCNKCNKVWPLEDNTFYCPYGHAQKTHYRDSVLELESGDEIIADYGDIIYVLRRSGVVTVGYRHYDDFATY